MTKKRIPFKREYSAGGVVYQRPKLLWLLVKHSGYHKWVLPKGLVEKGEDPVDTALREVEEEGGVKAKLIARIPQEVKYFYFQDGYRISKQVDFYLMEYQSGEIANHDWEMEDALWLPYEEAINKLAFDSERKVLEKAREMVGDSSL